MILLRALVGIVFLLAASLICSANPVPFVNNPLVPASVAPGGAAFTLTVNGTGFISGSVVKWNGQAQPTTFVSQSQLKASISAPLIANPATASITVFSPAPGGGASNPAYLSVLSPVRSVRFAPNFGVAKGRYLGELLTADFNGDGKIDLAATSGDNLTWAKVGAVGVILGNGDGTFQRLVQYPTLLFPGPLAGDVNGDGYADLIIFDEPQYLVPGISVFFGNGDGTFQARNDYATATATSTAVLADFNGDGKLDIGILADTQMGVELGNGDGTFQQEVISGGGLGGTVLAVGDFNNDGKLDVAASSFSQTRMWAALGNGDGTFQNGVTLFPNGQADGLLVADFNGDGVLDLATSSQTGVSVLLGLGNGNFRAGIVSPDVPNITTAITAADLNGDGKLDLVLAHPNESHVSILLGNGDGTFQAATILNRPSPSALVLGDFNNDGRMDFAFILNNGSDDGNSSVNIDLQMVP